MGTARLIPFLLLLSAACSAPSDEEAWIELFNGQDLDDWTVKIRGYPAGENYADTFRVEDGLMTARYDEYDGEYNDRFGHIFHKTPFSHYRILVEYRFIGEQAPGHREEDQRQRVLQNFGRMRCQVTGEKNLFDRQHLRALPSRVSGL